MKVLSLFDGISCGQVALERANIKVDEYFASEIKQIAINVTQQHYPNTIQIGDVNKINGNDYKNIDILMGGSPCQDFSLMKTNGLGLEGDKSKLFYQYLRLLKEIEPKYFLLENVRMNKKSERELNEYLGVTGIHINSKLVSYQNRPRIYWTNIPNITIPEDKNINFQDYKDMDYEYCKQFKVNKTPSRIKMWNGGIDKIGLKNCANVTNSDKIYCITRKQDRSPNSGLIEFDGFCRFLTRREIEQGQTLPIGYTDILSYNQMQDVCGDGWTVDVIAHILRHIKD